MTKTVGLTGWAGGDHVTDLDLAIGDDNTGYQPLDQLPLLLPTGLFKTLAHALAEPFHVQPKARSRPDGPPVPRVGALAWQGPAAAAPGRAAAADIPPGPSRPQGKPRSAVRPAVAGWAGRGGGCCGAPAVPVAANARHEPVPAQGGSSPGGSASGRGHPRPAHPVGPQE